MWWVVSQRLLGLNPTTVLVVLLLGLWLFLGCDKNDTKIGSTFYLFSKLDEMLQVSLFTSWVILDQAYSAWLEIYYNKILPSAGRMVCK